VRPRAFHRKLHGCAARDADASGGAGESTWADHDRSHLGDPDESGSGGDQQPSEPASDPTPSRPPDGVATLDVLEVAGEQLGCCE
jgi:hypothetical protein